VYRTLELFEEIGITTRVYSGWKYKVELSDDFSPHHHHMTCTNCGEIISFEESDAFLRELDRISKNHGFKSESHSLELKGLCKNCG
jgi:Fur family ferric uptake transcriptional regulator